MPNKTHGQLQITRADAVDLSVMRGVVQGKERNYQRDAHNLTPRPDCLANSSHGSDHSASSSVLGQHEDLATH